MAIYKLKIITMNKITKFLSLALILSLTVLFSCKKDENDAPAGSHKVVFKLVGSSGVNLSTVVYSDGSGKTESFTSLSGSSWTSEEYIIPSSAQVVAFTSSAIGPDASSTMVAEIWVDGEKKAEGKSTGTVLGAAASYSFK